MKQVNCTFANCGVWFVHYAQLPWYNSYSYQYLCTNLRPVCEVLVSDSILMVYLGNTPGSLCFILSLALEDAAT